MTISLLLDELERWDLAEGSTDTGLPHLTLMRRDSPSDRFAVEYKPCLCICAQGRKRARVGACELEYNPAQYLVTSLPLPVEAQILDATPDRPFLALALGIDIAAAGQLLLEMDGGPPPSTPEAASQMAMKVTPLHHDLTEAVTRMLRAGRDPLERRLLGPALYREVLFRLLRGPQGEQVRALVLRDGADQRVARAVTYLREHYRRSVEVAEVARHVGVSVSTLHHTFKEVTALAPMQYLKMVRLHQARLRMLTDGLNASEAAFEVGYSSPSQFSREYKRLFGQSPARAIRELRGATA